MTKVPVPESRFFSIRCSGDSSAGVECHADQFLLYEGPDGTLIVRCAMCGANHTMRDVRAAETVQGAKQT